MILAVDGGNSKTDVALVTPEGRLLAAVRGPTTSHQQVGLAVGIERLAGLVADVRAAAGLPPGAPPASIGVFGLAGADTTADTRRLTAAIAAQGLAVDTVVVNDGFTPIRVASDRGWGVALICGSGVNAAAIAPNGRTARLAALGPISGDWGGGIDIGTAGLGAAVRARDGRGPRTTLETLVPTHFGLTRPIEVTRRLEAGTLEERRLGELSRVVFEAAAVGDRVARSIVDRQADELIAMAGAIIRRLHLTRLDPVVALAGGIFAADDEAFEERIRDGIRRVAPAATVRRSAAPPVLGAALLGLDRLLAGDDAGHAAAVKRARATLGEWRA
ncbi:MAG TPA: BadF/BadG/BcrA/BcrD ATPase family protein [Candidatus Limnocylindrales bacterium]|nr:BadF/BadG/BcrA/BcrD ATPase family protein [Candidatus Limnocylindrales bacterium]